MRFRIMAAGILLVACGLISGCSQRGELQGAAGAQKTEMDPPASGGVPTIEASPEWFGCKKSSDCIEATGPCGGPTGVNRQFEAPYTQFVHDIAPQIDCMPIQKQPPAKIECVSHRCAVITTSE